MLQATNKMSAATPTVSFKTPKATRAHKFTETAARVEEATSNGTNKPKGVLAKEITEENWPPALKWWSWQMERNLKSSTTFSNSFRKWWTVVMIPKDCPHSAASWHTKLCNVKLTLRQRKRQSKPRLRTKNIVSRAPHSQLHWMPQRKPRQTQNWWKRERNWSHHTRQSLWLRTSSGKWLMQAWWQRTWSKTVQGLHKISFQHPQSYMHQRSQKWEDWPKRTAKKLRDVVASPEMIGQDWNHHPIQPQMICHPNGCGQRIQRQPRLNSKEQKESTPPMKRSLPKRKATLMTSQVNSSGSLLSTEWTQLLIAMSMPWKQQLFWAAHRSQQTCLRALQLHWHPKRKQKNLSVVQQTWQAKRQRSHRLQTNQSQDGWWHVLFAKVLMLFIETVWHWNSKLCVPLKMKIT